MSVVCASHLQASLPVDVCVHCLYDQTKSLHASVLENRKDVQQLKKKYQAFAFYFFLSYLRKLEAARKKKVDDAISARNNYNIKMRPEWHTSPDTEQNSPLGRSTSVTDMALTSRALDTPLPHLSPPHTLFSPVSPKPFNTEAFSSPDSSPPPLPHSSPLPLPVPHPLPHPKVPALEGNAQLVADAVALQIPSTHGVASESYSSQLIHHFHHIVFENALDPILIHDLEGNIVDANGPACLLTGYTIKELLQKNVRELEKRYKAPDPKVFEQLMSGAAFKIYGEHVSKAGREYPVEVSISLVTVEAKHYVVGMFRDLTEIIRLEILAKENEIAQAKNKAKSVFLSTMSHELRTPLYGVMASLEWLYKRVTFSKKELEVMDCAMSSTYMLKSIVSDVLDLSVLETGVFQLNNNSFSLLSDISLIMQLISEAAQAKDIYTQWIHNSVDVMKQPQSYKSPKFKQISVVGDSGRLKQVLLNVLSNAVKFTPAKGKVLLNSAVVDEDDRSYKIRIEIVDTGAGIDREQQKRIFDMFTQADEGGTRTFGGTGLGLYISNQLIQLMGGTIGVESVVGKGSTFKICIPFPKSDIIHNQNDDMSRATALDSLTLPAMLLGLLPRGPTAKLSLVPSISRHLRHRRDSNDVPSPEPQRKSLSILMVEDNLINQKVGIRLLKLLGITKVEVAGDGVECLQRVEGRIQEEIPMYDLILMDKQMPNLDGMEATRMIRKLELEKGLPHVNIFALTADCRSCSEAEVRAAGMDDYIAKPVTSRSMKAALVRHGLLDDE